MQKSLVFISHIGAEAAIATEFKALVERHFLGLIEVFVSSDGTSIQMGQRWLDDISKALERCSVEIVICSSISVQRPWINFEAGAGWVRGIPVIPLCHSGLEPSKLPVPLNLLQAAKATEIGSLKLIFPVLAEALGSEAPTVDFTEFIQKVTDFEKQYTFWNQCNEAFDAIQKIDSKIVGALKSQQTFTINLTELQISRLTPFMNFLQTHDILDFRRVENSMVTTTGVYYDCTFNPMTKFNEVITNANFKH